MLMANPVVTSTEQLPPTGSKFFIKVSDDEPTRVPVEASNTTLQSSTPELLVNTLGAIVNEVVVVPKVYFKK